MKPSRTRRLSNAYSIYKLLYPLYVPFDKLPGKAFLLKGGKLVSFMQEAGGYFFSQGPGRGKPGLDTPTDGNRLDRAQDSVGMHAAKFSRPKDLGYRALDYYGGEIQLAESFTRSHKSHPGPMRRTAAKQILQGFSFNRHLIFQPGDGIVSRMEFSSFYGCKPPSERLKGVWLLLHAVDNESWFGEGYRQPLRAK
jgi:hypothetical protein